MTLPDKIPMPHGGALFTGGVPGHKGGSGRPRSAVVKASREAYEQRIPILNGIADDPEQKASDRIAAVRVLAQVGMDSKPITAADIQERLAATIDMLDEILPNELATLARVRLKVIWSGKE